MPVFTQKEREALSLKKEDIGKGLPVLVGSENNIEPTKIIKEKKFNYFLLHPENGMDSFQEFNDTIEIKGKAYDRVCKGGVVKTFEEPLVKFLLKKGYLLMEKIERL